MITAIVLASGKGERMGLGAASNKCFLSLGARPVVAWSLIAFEHCQDVDRIILTVRKDQVNAAKGICQMFGISKVQKIIPGGTRRQDSVWQAMKEVSPETRYVVIHDAARPCVTAELISETIKFARRCGSGVAARPVTDTIKVVGKGMIVESTPVRDALWAVQTPQTFQFEELRKAYESLNTKDKTFTDDAAILEAAGGAPRLVEWTKANPKIMVPEDLAIAAAILKIS